MTQKKKTITNIAVIGALVVVAASCGKPSVAHTADKQFMTPEATSTPTAPIEISVDTITGTDKWKDVFEIASTTKAYNITDTWQNDGLPDVLFPHFTYNAVVSYDYILNRSYVTELLKSNDIGRIEVKCSLLDTRPYTEASNDFIRSVDGVGESIDETVNGMTIGGTHTITVDNTSDFPIKNIYDILAYTPGLVDKDGLEYSVYIRVEQQAETASQVVDEEFVDTILSMLTIAEA